MLSGQGKTVTGTRFEPFEDSPPVPPDYKSVFGRLGFFILNLSMHFFFFFVSIYLNLTITKL